MVAWLSCSGSTPRRRTAACRSSAIRWARGRGQSLDHGLVVVRQIIICRTYPLSLYFPSSHFLCLVHSHCVAGSQPQRRRLAIETLQARSRRAQGRSRSVAGSQLRRRRLAAGRRLVAPQARGGQVCSVTGSLARRRRLAVSAHQASSRSAAGSQPQRRRSSGRFGEIFGHPLTLCRSRGSGQLACIRCKNKKVVSCGGATVKRQPIVTLVGMPAKRQSSVTLAVSCRITRYAGCRHQRMIPRFVRVHFRKGVTLVAQRLRGAAFFIESVSTCVLLRCRVRRRLAAAAPQARIRSNPGVQSRRLSQARSRSTAARSHSTASSQP